MRSASLIPPDLMAEKAPEVAEFMRQFSSPNRLLLLCQIAQQECSVSDIQEAVGMKQPALSQQLAELRQAGLVKTRRQSRQIYYSIADARVEAILHLLQALFCSPQAIVVQPAEPASMPVQRPEGRPPVLAPGDAAHFARIVPAPRARPDETVPEP